MSPGNYTVAPLVKFGDDPRTADVLARGAIAQIMIGGLAPSDSTDARVLLERAGLRAHLRVWYSVGEFWISPGVHAMSWHRFVVGVVRDLIRGRDRIPPARTVQR